MARTKGMLNLSGNLEVNAGAPLDARSVVPTVADLTVASNFQYKYVGMPVVVQATGDMYVLTANDVTVAANWKQIGSGGGGPSYTAGDGINITNDEISVKAGSNLSFDSSGNLNATDTTYTAGTGIDITNGVISATGGGGTSYTAGDGIVIDNDEISIDEMASADMSEIVTPLPSVMSRYHTYSEDEQIVGYWEETVNGVKVRKPLYEKTIRADGFRPTTSWYTIGQVPNDIEDIKDIRCRYKEIDTNDASYVVYHSVNNEGDKWELFWKIDMQDSGNIKVSTDTAWGNTHQLLIIMYIYYTKTTDTPV